MFYNHLILYANERNANGLATKIVTAIMLKSHINNIHHTFTSERLAINNFQC